MEIVLYEGGSGGDMISATIDNRNYAFDGMVFHPVYLGERLKLRLNHFVFNMTDEDRDAYITEMSFKYKAIPSHLFDYHISRKHDCLFIDSSDIDMNTWRLQRLSSLYDISRWSQSLDPDFILQNSSQLSAIGSNFPRKIKLRDILEGKLLLKLREYGHEDLNEALYYEWLDAVLKLHPL